MAPLHILAEQLGIMRQWWSVEGEEQIVSDCALATIATALGYPAHTTAQITESLTRLTVIAAQVPKMIVTQVGRPTPLPAGLQLAQITWPDGSIHGLAIEGASLPAIDTPGYYPLTINGHDLTLAVAPASAPSLSTLGTEHQGLLWGTAVQIPALRTEGRSDFGTFAELAQAVEVLARFGADALAINPVHALFAGYGIGFSPYSPSSRIHLNTAMGDPALLGLPPLPEVGEEHSDAERINWEAALPQRLARLRRYFDALPAPTREAIWRDNADDYGLYQQALFDALDGHFRAQGLNGGWPTWPSAYHDASSSAVSAFAAQHQDAIAFHLFLQWLARESLIHVQAKAKASGMALGLIADLAVGVHLGGSDTWAMGNAMLRGLTIGAPPDPLGPKGQNWMLTSFSPQGLQETGYAPWIATLRAALASAGALRIDHAFGLARLWVVPEGCSSSQGAYLRYPFQDLLRLVALEAHLAGAVIIAEDLGTMPDGFAHAIATHGIMGMRVLWFERAADQGFIGAQDYSPHAVAMTGTHDTATIAGWWSGRDLEWADALDRLPAGKTLSDMQAQRDWDRGLLWATLTHNREPRPAPEHPEPVVTAALRHIGQSPCPLAIAPLEDILAEREQPNLPGTITEHPNWRRRLSAPLDVLLQAPEIAERLSALAHARKTGTRKAAAHSAPQDQADTLNEPSSK